MKIINTKDGNGHKQNHQVKTNVKMYVYTILYKYDNAGNLIRVNTSFNETLLLDCDNESYTTITNDCKPYTIGRPLKRAINCLYDTWTTSDNKTKSISYYYVHNDYTNLRDFINQRLQTEFILDLR